jgi:Leucine-rich repeat (LRR) protein
MITDLSRLEELNLSKNRFEIFPKETARLKNLRVLILSRNRLGYIPKNIAKYPKLEELDMYDNPIGDLGDGIFSLTTLRRLDLRGLMYNTKSQAEIRNKLPNVKVLFDPPCNCMD